MQRAILFLLLSTLPASAECSPFSHSSYDSIVHMRKVMDPDWAVAHLGCTDNGEEISRIGDERTVIYRSTLGGFIAIRWRGDTLVAISESGLQQ
jgi:hypothetical protein